MAPSLKGKAKRFSFYDYLDGLREEFELLTDEINNMKKQKDELDSETSP